MPLCLDPSTSLRAGRRRAAGCSWSVNNQFDGIFSDSLASELVTPVGSPSSGYTLPPYAADKGQRLLNSRDMIFREGGTQLILPLVETQDGYAATYRIAMRPSTEVTEATDSSHGVTETTEVSEHSSGPRYARP
jgi:hypothetical protein